MYKNLNEIEALLQVEAESSVLEFKRAAALAPPLNRAEIAKDVSAFANAR